MTGPVDWTLEPDVEALAGELAALEDEAARLRVKLRRLRWARGGARVRNLRQELRLVRLMLVRQQRARDLSQPHRLGLVGGREQLQERLAELPSVGNPYTSMGGR